MGGREVGNPLIMAEEPASTYAMKIFQDLMDLDLLLQDANKMIALRMFLESVDPSNEALKRLHDEILTVKRHISDLASIAEKRMKGLDL
jgi:hypothetical protein